MPFTRTGLTDEGRSPECGTVGRHRKHLTKSPGSSAITWGKNASNAIAWARIAPHFPWGSWAPKDHLSNNAIMPSVTDNPVEYTSLRRGFSSTARFANSRSTCVSPFRMMSAKRASTASDPVRMAMGASRFWQRAFRPPPYHVRTCTRRALYFRNFWFH